MAPDGHKPTDDDFLKAEDLGPHEPSVQDKPIEQIDSFEPLTELGMMDHRPLETFSDIPAPLEAQPQLQPEVSAPEQLAPVESVAEPTPLDTIREYSENTMNLSAEPEIQYPFHFYAEGEFGYYERDKLLRFITENPVGITSAEIDLQIQSGRVLIPRISEFAGIKLIQELRDSPLTLKLKPSSRDADDIYEQNHPQQFQYDINQLRQRSPVSNILVLDANSPDRNSYQEFDQLQATQYLRAEMVEAEKSDLFQELLARMIESLKKRAQLKGADAITQPTTQVLALRLPSQYQVVLTTTLLKRKVNA